MGKQGNLDKSKNTNSTQPTAETREEKALLFCHRNGHSRIVESDWGYIYCCRCGQQIGDLLGGGFRVTDEYMVGHDDRECLDNWLNLTKEDKHLVPRKYWYKKKAPKETS